MRTLCIAILAAWACTAQQLPNPQLTPGSVRNVTLAQVCTPGYSRRVRQQISEEEWRVLKHRVLARYQSLSAWPDSRLSFEPQFHLGGDFFPLDTPGASFYELDHLIPISLAGANSIENLWPEPWQGAWGAHVKDKLESRMHRLVCPDREGRVRLSLGEAQHAIATNWIEAYKRYMPMSAERR